MLKKQLRITGSSNHDEKSNLLSVSSIWVEFVVLEVRGRSLVKGKNPLIVNGPK